MTDDATPTKNDKHAKNDKRKAAFSEAVNRINKSYQKNEETDDVGLAKLGEYPRDVHMISTGSAVLDWALGGGIGVGRVIEMFGPEGSGKTSFALTAIANVQREGGNAAFVDLENALDPQYAQVLGVDTDNLAVAQIGVQQTALNTIEQLVDSQVVDIIVVDSIAAMTPREEFDGSMDDKTMGLQAKILSTALRKIIAKIRASGTTIIFTNQLREKVGVVYGNPEITPGGKAMRFFASQRVEVRRKKPVTGDNKEAIGNTIKIKVIKNKVAPPFKEAETVLSFNRGVNRAAELVEIGPSVGAIEKPNNRTYVHPDTGERIATSKADAVKELENNQELFESLWSKFNEIVNSQNGPVSDKTELVADAAPQTNDDDESETE